MNSALPSPFIVIGMSLLDLSAANRWWIRDVVSAPVLAFVEAKLQFPSVHWCDCFVSNRKRGGEIDWIGWKWIEAVGRNTMTGHQKWLRDFWKCKLEEYAIPMLIVYRRPPEHITVLGEMYAEDGVALAACCCNTVFWGPYWRNRVRFQWGMRKRSTPEAKSMQFLERGAEVIDFRRIYPCRWWWAGNPIG